MPFILRNIWTSALFLFSLLMFTTFFITKVWQATVMIALVGICWAVACWVPFAIIMEYLKEVDDDRLKQEEGNHNYPSRARGPSRSRSPLGPPYKNTVTGRPMGSRAMSTPALWNPPTREQHNERTALLVRSLSVADMEEINEHVEYEGSKPAGGTIMGIHNLAIVFPQFLVSLWSPWCSLLDVLFFRFPFPTGEPISICFQIRGIGSMLNALFLQTDRHHLIVYLQDCRRRSCL